MNTTSSQTTHAPSHLREQFQEWLDLYEPNRLQEIDLRPVASLLDALADCGGVLPADFCDQLEISKGSSYAEAVADVRQWCAGLTEVSESPVEFGTMPDYGARDQEWREESDDLEEPDE